MSMKLIGFKKTSFTPKDSSDVISGVNLYVAYPDTNVEGEKCERFFLSDRKIGKFHPAVGIEIAVEWNKYGKVEAVRAL